MKTASQRTQKGVFDQTKRLNKYKELQETPRTLVQTSTIDMHTHHAASTHNIYTHRSYQHAHKKHLHNPMWAEIHTRVGSKNTHTPEVSGVMMPSVCCDSPLFGVSE